MNQPLQYQALLNNSIFIGGANCQIQESLHDKSYQKRLPSKVKWFLLKMEEVLIDQRKAQDNQPQKLF